MKQDAYESLLQCLKMCEKNYHAHVREHGKLSKSDISLWSEHLKDIGASKIRLAFNAHIQSSPWFPTVSEIRDLASRKRGDDWDRSEMLTWDPLYALPDGSLSTEHQPMPENVKRSLHELMEKARESIKQDKQKKHGERNKFRASLAR